MLGSGSLSAGVFYEGCTPSSIITVPIEFTFGQCRDIDGHPRRPTQGRPRTTALSDGYKGNTHEVCCGHVTKTAVEQAIANFHAAFGHPLVIVVIEWVPRIEIAFKLTMGQFYFGIDVIDPGVPGRIEPFDLSP